MAERFLESDDDLEELDEDNLSENVDNCLELAAQKFQDPVDYANLNIENTQIIFGIHLMSYLFSNGILSLGTVRRNRLPNCKFSI